MSIEVEHLGNSFFAEVRNVDIGKPLDADCVEAIRQAQRDHGFFLFRGAHLDDVSQEDFTAHFGPVELNLRSDLDNVVALSNVDLEGNFRDPNTAHASFLRANQQWHSGRQFSKFPRHCRSCAPSTCRKKAAPPNGRTPAPRGKPCQAHARQNCRTW